MKQLTHILRKKGFTGDLDALPSRFRLTSLPREERPHEGHNLFIPFRL